MDVRRNTRPAALALCAALAACGDGATAPAGSQSVSVRFGVGHASASASSAAATVESARLAATRIEGTNGTLDITGVRLIVAELELEAGEGDCAVGGDDDCPDFSAPPTFLDLPLDGRGVTVASDAIPAGSYTELEFEVEDLEDDEDDGAHSASIAALWEQVRAQVPDWPRKATLMVSGTFTDLDGGVTPFRTFVAAEVEVELDLEPPFVVVDEPGAPRTLQVDVRPAEWFRAGAAVVDLAAYDYERTGRILELEAEIEGGFVAVEIDG